MCIYLFIYSDKSIFVCQSSLFKLDCSDDFSCKGLREKCSTSLSIRIDGILRGAEYPLIAPWNRLEKMFVGSGGWAHSSAFLCSVAAVAPTLITSIFVCWSLFSFTCPNEISRCNSNTPVFSREANVCTVVLTQTLQTDGCEPPSHYTWAKAELREIPWRRKWQPIPVFLTGESHGQRSWAGCSPWDHQELDTTEQLTLSFSDHCGKNSKYCDLISWKMFWQKKYWNLRGKENRSLIHNQFGLLCPTRIIGII